MCRKLQDHLSATSNCEDGCNDEHDSAEVKRQRYKDQRRLGEEDAGDEGPDSPKGEAEDDVHYGEHNGNGRAESGVDECSATTAGESNGALESASEDGEADDDEDDEESEEEELLVETVAEFFERLVRERAEQAVVVSDRSSTVNREEQAVLVVTMDENCNQLVAAVRRRERQLQGSVRQSFIECGEGSADQIDAAMLLSESCDCGMVGELEGHEEEGTVRVAEYYCVKGWRVYWVRLRSALVRVIVWGESPGLYWA